MKPQRERHPCPPETGSCGLRVLSLGAMLLPAEQVGNPSWRMDACALLMNRLPGGRFRNDRIGETVLDPGAVFALLPGVTHSYGSLPGRDYGEFALFIDGPLPRMLIAEGLLDAARPVWPSRSDCEALFEQALAAARQRRWQDLPLTALQLLHRLTGRCPSGDRSTDDPVRRIAAALRRDPARDWDMRALAAEAAMSYSTFRQRFSRSLGMPPQRYLTAERMRLAAELLSRGGAVAAVAAQVGIPDANYFARLFRREQGMSPRSFRASICLHG